MKKSPEDNEYLSTGSSDCKSDTDDEYVCSGAEDSCESEDERSNNERKFIVFESQTSFFLHVRHVVQFVR